jgi:hypothetical protein
MCVELDVKSNVVCLLYVCWKIMKNSLYCEERYEQKWEILSNRAQQCTDLIYNYS